MGTKPFEIPYQNITSLSFKPDGTYFVTGDQSGSLCQWSATDRSQVSLWTIKTGEHINAVVVSADGRWIVLVSGGAGIKVTIWSTVTQECVTEVTEHTSAIRALDISSDSTRFASGSTDSTVQIFDITSGTRLIPPLQYGGKLAGVKFSPDGSRIAIAAQSYSSYLSVIVYNTSSGNNLFEISPSGNPPRWPHIQTSVALPAIAWASDGQQFFIASPNAITCFDTSTTSYSPGWSIYGDPRVHGNFSIVTSGKFIACCSGSLVSFWDSSSRKHIGQNISHATVVKCMAISHDGRRLACGHDQGVTIHSLEGIIPEHYLPGILCLPLMQVSATALKSWATGNPTETEAILSNEIAQRSNPTHYALATCALIQTHLGEWRKALETAGMSLQIRPSPIGRIARSIALVDAGEQEVVLDELDLVFHDCDPSDIKLLLVVNSIFLFVCNKRKAAISRLRHIVDACDAKTKGMYLQVLGMMYLKQGDYVNAVQALGIVNNPFTVEDRGPLMTLFIIFNWNFEDLKVIAWERACERLYASGSIPEVLDTLLKMINTVPEDERELARCRILQEIITRSGEVTLLAWTGKSSACNSCLPSSPTAYAQTSPILPCLAYEEEELRNRIAELRTIVPLADALMTHGSITRSQPVRFAHLRLHLPCIVFHVKTLRKVQENDYHAETIGLGDVRFTTADSLPLKEPRRLVFVNPWIHHLRESRGVRDEKGLNSMDVASSLDAVEVVHESIIEEIPSRTLDEDVHTRTMELIAHLGQSFSALLLLKQPDGAYKRIAADHEIIVHGIEDDVLRDIRIEVLEVV